MTPTPPNAPDTEPQASYASMIATYSDTELTEILAKLRSPAYRNLSQTHTQCAAALHAEARVRNLTKI